MRICFIIYVKKINTFCKENVDFTKTWFVLAVQESGFGTFSLITYVNKFLINESMERMLNCHTQYNICYLVPYRLL